MYWQNQRHYGVFGWNSPAPFERKEWTDAKVNDVASPLESPNSNWQPLIDDSTDDYGWVYSTSFDHIDHPREGGRACKRSTDRVRKREWIPRDDQLALGRSESTRIQHPVDLQKGLQQFMMLLAELGTRRKLWDCLPWDPVAWLLIHNEHQEYLDSFQKIQMELKDCITQKQSSAIVSELLDDLFVGSTFSRAAYGYAAEAGHLDTIEACVAMHTIHSRYFNPVAGASVDANLEAVKNFTGFEKEDIIMSEWKNREYQPCHFIAVDHKHERLIISIRGSMELGDMVTDISGASLKVDIGGVSGAVHEGSMASAVYIQCNTASILLDFFEKNPNWSLLITGHSLGGGVAALLAMIVRFENTIKLNPNKIKCVAVGPSAVMSENLAELCKDFVTSLVFRFDVVPRLSGYSVESLLVELAKASPVKNTINSLLKTASTTLKSIKQRFGSAPSLLEKANVEDLRYVQVLAADKEVVNGALHAIEGIETKAPRDSKRPLFTSFIPLYPPGRVFWLLGSHFGNEKLNLKKKSAWWDQIHDWANKNLFQNVQQDSQKSVHPTSTKVTLFVIGMNENIARDWSWLEHWVQQHEPDKPTKEMNDCESASDGVLIEAERKSFSRLLVSPNMIQDHLPNSYVISITKLRDNFHHK